MIRWRKTRTVASFEFVSTVKRKGYLITTFGMPVFVLLYGALISLIGVVTAEKEFEIGVYGVVDRAGALRLDAETEASSLSIPDDARAEMEARGLGELLDRGLAWSNFAFRPLPDEEAGRAELLAGEIKGFFVIHEDYLDSGGVETWARKGVDFQGSESRRALSNLILNRLLKDRVSPDVAERVREPVVKAGEWTLLDDGTVEQRNVFAVIGRLIVPVVFAVLLFLSLMMTAGYLMQGTAVEKENKVVEILLSSANPDEILTGKLLGLGAAGLLQVLVWFGMVIVAVLASAVAMQVAGLDLPWAAMILALPFFLGGYLFLGSLMLGTGSLGSTAKESQQLSLVWTLLALLPLVFMQVMIFEPNGTLARVFTWIPFTSPVTAVLRLTLEPEGVAWWEIGGTLVVLVLSIWLALRFGAGLFRVGLLLSGERPKLREILRQARLGGGHFPSAS